MNSKTLIAQFRHFIPFPARTPNKLTELNEAQAHTIEVLESRLKELEKALQYNGELFSDRIKENNFLRKEREYIHDIYLHRSGCRFDMQFDGSGRMLLYTTSLEPREKSLIIYLPSEQIKVAEINLTPAKNRLTVSIQHLNYSKCDIRTGRAILLLLIDHAKKFRVPQVEGHFQETAGISLSEQSAYYRQIGFETPDDIGQGPNTILYRLKNHSI